MKRNVTLIAIVFGIAGFSCSKIDTPQGLKQTVERNVADINTAISKISSSKGYQLLSQAGDLTKSEDSFNDTISLGMIAGIYDFQPEKIVRHHYFHPYRLFKKTGESENMIVNLPERMIFHPKYLHYYKPNDTVPIINNFTITASDYHLYFNWWNSYDYLLSAGLTLDSEDAGSLEVTAASNSARKRSYTSKYTFTEGYNISTEWQTGDTTVSSFALSKDEDILLKETVVFIWKDYHKREKQYTLSIGNIDIRRTKGVDSIEVFLDGVLQSEAGAFITDTSSTTGSICHERDILLTFDDGTTAKLSELIDPARTALRTLVDSLHNMYFAKNIVDYIAMSIYFNTR